MTGSKVKYLTASLSSKNVDQEQGQDDSGNRSNLKLSFVSSHSPQPLSRMEICILMAYTDVNPVDVQKLEQYIKQQQKAKKQRLEEKEKNENEVVNKSEMEDEELFVVGYGGSGYVEEIGEDVPKGRFQQGQAIAFLGDSSKKIGSYGTKIYLDYRLAAPIPNLSEEGEKEEDFDAVMEAAASIGVAGNTAYEALEKVGLTLSNSTGPVSHVGGNASQTQQTLLVVGGSGGVGSWVTRLARAVYPNEEELEIVVTSSTPNDPSTREWLLNKNGATRVIGHDEIGSPEKLPGGRAGSCDYIICLTEPTAPLMSSMAEVIKPFGTICLVVAGASISHLNLGFVFFKSATVTTETVFSTARNGFKPLNQSAQMTHILQMMFQKQKQNSEKTNALQAPLRPDRCMIPGVTDWTRALEPGGVWEVMSNSVLNLSTNSNTSETSNSNVQEEARRRHYGKLVMKITVGESE